MSDPVTETITSADVGEVPDIVRPSKSPRVAALLQELQKEKEALEAELKPYREFYEAHVNDPKFIAAKVKIKEINAKLFPIFNEIAAIARSKGAKSIKAEAGEYKTKEQ